MKFITGHSAWEDNDWIVTIRPETEPPSRAVPIGGVLDREVAIRVADWLMGTLPELWTIFTNVQKEEQGGQQ